MCGLFYSLLIHALATLIADFTSQGQVVAGELVEHAIDFGKG